MVRKRIQVKSSSLVGSSDFTRVKSKRAILELNHKEFVKNFNLMTINKSSENTSKKEPSPNTMVKVLIRGKYISVEYAIAKAAKYNWTL